MEQRTRRGLELAAAVGTLVLAGCLTGCDHSPSGPPIFQVSGHYEGSLTTHLSASYVQTSVHADITPTQKTPITLSVDDETGTTRLQVQILAADDSTVTLQASPGMEQSLVLTLDSNGAGCYEASADVKITLCPSSSDLTLEIKDIKSGVDTVSLVLHQFNTGDAAQTPENSEKPQAYTLTQAIDRARSASFQSRIEYEHVVQAKNQAKAAYLHLLPQITLATVANNLAPCWATALQDIGDLAPFLLPDRWFQAAAAGDQSKAEQDTFTLMRLDMGVQVEGLFYAYARDQRSVAFTQDILNQAVAIRNEVSIRENLGQLPAGSTENMDSIVNQLQQSLTVFNQVLPEDLSAISSSLGYFDPQTVTSATIDNELVPVENAPAMDYNTVNAAALGRSYELDQMTDLIAAAGLEKKASFFSWLDPYGDPNLGLGAALPAEVSVESSQIQELGIDRDQLKSIISQKAFDAVTDYMTALQSYKEAADGVKIQRSLLDTEKNYLESGTKVDLFGLIQIFQSDLAAELNQESARANYRVARSEIDRLLLQGYYADF